MQCKFNTILCILEVFMNDYTLKLTAEYQERLERVLDELPFWCKDFFVSMAIKRRSIRTQLSYSYDVRSFMNYMRDTAEFDITDVSVLDRITVSDIESYMFTLSSVNSESDSYRKLCVLRTFYNYFYKNSIITNNTPQLIGSVKVHEKNIIFLEPDETAKLLDAVESGENLVGRQNASHQLTKYRDLAICTLLLGTGIRVSELVGLDLKDVDLKEYAVKILRKGGNEAIVYFGDEVAIALADYLELERANYKPNEENESAFFLSLKHQRITVRAVENLVKKYAISAVPLKHITPHKLRATFGTTLYNETGDIYDVADALGHKDVNTTKEHYANFSDERRRAAFRTVRLRENTDRK